MNWLASLWHSTQLVWSICTFLSRLCLAELAQRKLLLVSTGVVLLVTAIAVLQGVKVLETALESPAPVVLAIHTEPASKTYRLSPSELKEQLDFFLELEKQQPTHAQTLLNIGIIYEALGNTRESEYYFNRAANNTWSSQKIIRD
ncbi:MAG: hypothetical protein GW946_00530 [Candidatus Pacebacteria bacterium]|nr:hypothetical protein [Candidatus Paceibacterota bacterium]PIR60902.1 MAG: hypothetical protein COU67_00390 [Candidatus Pacebacteria bacterium CG10_big_fil_rev_8_21_14_0_10_44_54]